MRLRTEGREAIPGRSRPRAAIRPAVEALEGRALLAAFSALDPAFGQGGLVSEGGSAAPDLTASAVQADGKVVVAGVGPAAAGFSLIVRRYDADGTPDATFGTSGEVDIPEPAGVNGGGDTGFFGSDDLILQADGKIVVGATYAPPEPTGPGQSLATEILRLDSDGQVDTTFGQAGKVVLDSEEDDLTRLALQADGQIVAAGNVTPPGASAPVAAAARLDADGGLDATFGTGGLFTAGNTTFGTVGDPGSGTLRDAAAVAIDPSSGKIVLAGTTQNIDINEELAEVIRLDGAGTPDTTFGQGGYDVTDPNQTVTAVAAQADGKILVAGNLSEVLLDTLPTYVIPILDRLDTDGTPDTAFNDAVAPFPAGAPNGPLYTMALGSLAVQPDGKIVVGGTRPAGTASIFAVARLLPDGSADAGFGVDGQITLPVGPPVLAEGQTLSGEPAVPAPAVALAPDGSVVLAGTVGFATINPSSDPLKSVVARLLPIALIRSTPGDYNGDGVADPAVFLTAGAVYAYRPSGGGPDVVQQFGIGGAGGSIPAPGDYDGDGITDLAIYLPSIGAFAIRPSSGGPDEIIPFGISGAGQTIPAPGDYDGSGRTELAAYFPASGDFAYRPADGGPDVVEPFGIPGAGQTVPAPGDYEGDGRTDFAAFFPASGDFAIRPASGAPDIVTPFGIPGAGQTIPVPGDYDGDGKTDLAIYVPSQALFVYRRSDAAIGDSDVFESFGIAGAGQTIPAPGDYNGDGATDIAAFLPSLALFAYQPSDRPSTIVNVDTPDVLQYFGAAGLGATIPASSLPYPGSGTVAAASASAVSSRSEVIVPLTDEMMAIPGQARRKGPGVAG